jgi:hypothetical protein
VQVNESGSTGMYSMLIGFKPDGTISLQKKLENFAGTEGLPAFIVQNGVAYICGMNQVNAYSTTDGSLLWTGLTDLPSIDFPALTVVS